MTDSLEWAWWTQESRGSRAARHLLPVGEPAGVRLRFDPDLWVMAPSFPDHYPIAVTVGRNPRYSRYLFLHPSDETVSLQRTPGTRDVEPVNSSVAALVSSIGMHAIWRGRMLSVRGSPEVDVMAAEATEHLLAIERAATGARHDLPRFWPNTILDLASLL